VREWSDATLSFSTALMDQYNSIGTTKSEVYEQAREITHKARKITEERRSALNTHMAEHGC